MNKIDLKEPCRFFYMVKGHLNTSTETILASYDSYFKRMWNNNEAYLHEQGFEEAYNKFILKNEKYLGKRIAKNILNKVYKHGNTKR